MQYTDVLQKKKFSKEKKNIVDDMFLILVQNTDFGYALEPPRRGGSNEYLHYVLDQNKNK